MDTDHSHSSPAPAAGVAEPPATPRRAFTWRDFQGMIFFTAALVILFGAPLFRLVAFAPHAELYSHILLIPFISGYLIWLKRGELAARPQPVRRWAWLPMAAGIAVLAVYFALARRGWSPAKEDYLAAMVSSFLCFLLAGGFIFLGSNYLRRIAFPVAFLFFCVPFPEPVRLELETLLQNGSSLCAWMFFKLAGTPVLVTGTQFQLPGFALQVAPECSGIHSSLVLIITSLLAAYLFLKSPLNRFWLVLAVIPLGLLRNGFRVWVIGELCVHIGPQMIDSPIHHRGGPVFFVLSLIPLFLLLIYLGKSEARKERAGKVRAKDQL